MKQREAIPQFDEIGYWSEAKLEIVQQCAAAYSTILSKQKEQQPTKGI